MANCHCSIFGIKSKFNKYINALSFSGGAEITQHKRNTVVTPDVSSQIRL